jgi:hypothetical protein
MFKKGDRVKYVCKTPSKFWEHRVGVVGTVVDDQRMGCSDLDLDAVHVLFDNESPSSACWPMVENLVLEN